MSVVRRFVVAPSLVRLIRKERGGSRITEGYFTPQGGRTSLVRIDGKQCHLVLVSPGADGASSEERTEVPRAHGEALLDVCSGKAAYDRTTVSLTGREVLIDRYVTPNGLDLISVAFDDEGSSKAFAVPPWFGAEVSADAAYERQNVALQGVPQRSETVLSNAALDAMLDLLEPRFGSARIGGAPVSPAPKPAPKPAAAIQEPKPPTEAAAPFPADPAPAANAAAVEPPAPPPEPEAVAPASSASGSVSSAPEAAAPSPTTDASRSRPAKEELYHAAPATDPSEAGGDSRIDDVIESLSQALGAAIQQPREPAKEDETASSFERWTVRPRRTQQ